MAIGSARKNEITDNSVHPDKENFDLPDYVDSISDFTIEVPFNVLTQHNLLRADESRNILEDGDYIDINDLNGHISFIQPSSNELFDPFHEDFPSVLDFISELINLVYSNEIIKYKNDLSVEPQQMPVRVNISRTIQGDILCVRKHPEETASLDQLYLPFGLYEILTHDSLTKGGIVVIAAENGQGKSTTMAATLKEYLKLHGGLAKTIEDPVELRLHGMSGKGRCFQTEIGGKTTFSSAAKDSARQFFSNGGNVLLLGEIRDYETAEVAIDLANRGVLVLTSIHGKSPQGVMSGLLTKISAGGNEAQVNVARESFANAFKLLICQTLEKHEDGVGQWGKRKINAQYLFNPNIGGNDITIREMIREDKMTGVDNETDRQSRLMDRAAGFAREAGVGKQYIAMVDLTKEERALRAEKINQHFMRTFEKK